MLVFVWPQLELDKAADDVYRLEDEGDFETDLAALVRLFAFGSDLAWRVICC